MKAYAHAALVVFFIVLGVKFYELKVKEQIHSKVHQSRDSVLASPRVAQELSQLEMVEPQNTPDRLAQLADTGEEDIQARISKLDQLSLELEQAILETGDNFEMIQHLKDKIAKLKDSASIGLNNVEEWDTELVYYLIIEERMTLEEINSLSSPRDLNLNENEWDTMVTQSLSPNFKEKIYQYKDINHNKYEQRLESLDREVAGSKELVEEVWGDEQGYEP